MPEKIAKFKVGDKILFSNRDYKLKEGTILHVVMEDKEGFNDIERGFYYKVSTNKIISFIYWISEDSIKGLL